ncbi:MAG: TIGR04282 family arsenosugar biosynthesis glycosyltransferase [Candidatus Nitrospinota bacterium M3_3B_026]
MKTLIIFAKAPIPGLVKTRLVEGTALDETRACFLYDAFLRDTMVVSTLTTAENIAVHFTPPNEGEMMKKIVKELKLGARNERRFTFRPQEGEYFSAKVANSFKAEKEAGGEELVMIGSDAPILKPEIIDTAFEFIFSRSGMALGPSSEGGVYLIGIPSSMTLDFEPVFSQGSELENLVEQAREAKMPFKLLPEVLDVDVEADLITLIGVTRALAYERNFESKIFPNYTYKAVEKLGLKVTRENGETRNKKVVLPA